MSRKDGLYVKRQRLLSIERAISKTFPDGVEFDKMVSLLEYEGYRKDTAERYILTVCSVKGWIIEDGIIKAE